MPKGTLHRTSSGARRGAAGLRSIIATRPTGSARGCFNGPTGSRDDFDLRGAAEPELERLRDLTGETVRLGMLDRGRCFTSISVRCRSPFGSVTAWAAEWPCTASGLGKANLLAHLSLERAPDALAAAQLEAADARYHRGFGRAVRQLDLTKARGYAVSVDEQHVGISSVAAPVLDRRGRALRRHRCHRPVVSPAGRPTPRARTRGDRGGPAHLRQYWGGCDVAGIQPATAGGADRYDVRCVIPASRFSARGPIGRPATANSISSNSCAIRLCRRSGEGAIVRARPELTSCRLRPAGKAAGSSPACRARSVPSIREERDRDCRPAGNRPAGESLQRRRMRPPGPLLGGDARHRHDTGAGAPVAARSGAGQASRNGSRLSRAERPGWSPDDRPSISPTPPSTRSTPMISTSTRARSRSAGVRDGVGQAREGRRADHGAEGFVWSAHWDGWCVTRYDPDGRWSGSSTCRCRGRPAACSAARTCRRCS